MIAMKKWVVKTQRKNEAERIVFSSYDRLNASIVYERMRYENAPCILTGKPPKYVSMSLWQEEYEVE